MLAVVAGSVAAFCLYRQINDQIRCHVESGSRSTTKTSRSAFRSRSWSRGRASGSTISRSAIRDVAGPAGELLHVEEALFECSTDWKELIKGDPPVRRVTIRRPTIRVAPRADGTWNLGELLPPPHFGNAVPDVSWESGTIEVVDPQKQPASKLVLRDVNLTIAPGRGSAGCAPVVRQLRGTLAGDGLHRVEFEGQFDVQKMGCSIRGRAEGVEISPELRDSLPEPLAAKWRRWAICAGRRSSGFSSITIVRPSFPGGSTWRGSSRGGGSTTGGCRRR